jgi:drug/metabolite transporter (DMT)-like permease
VKPSHLAVLVTLSVLWGSAFMLVDVALEELDPLTLVVGRLAFAAMFSGAVLLITRGSLPWTRRFWAPLAAMAVVNLAFPFTMLTWGQERIDSSLAAILTASMPLSTAVLAHFFIGEQITRDRAAGLAIGFLGVVVLFGPSFDDVTGSSTLGQLAVVAGVVGYSCGTVISRRYLTEDQPAAYSTGQTALAVLLLAPLAIAVDGPADLDLSPKVALAWVGLGVMSTAVAYLLFFWLIRRITATQMSTVSYLIPVSAVILGALVLDERLDSASFAGLALIIAGVWVVNGGGLWVRERFSRQRAAPRPVGGGSNGDAPREV